MLAAITASSALAAPVSEPSVATLEVRAGNYMGIVNEWRGKMKMEHLKHDGGLERNALNTVQESNGQMKHKLNKGSFGQVLAPGKCGDMNAFYSAFVGGWLCERPNLPGLNGVCNSLKSKWRHTSTGHADILTDKKYKKIGCACSRDIWSCDLGW